MVPHGGPQVPPTTNGSYVAASPSATGTGSLWPGTPPAPSTGSQISTSNGTTTLIAAGAMRSVR